MFAWTAPRVGAFHHATLPKERIVKVPHEQGHFLSVRGRLRHFWGEVMVLEYRRACGAVSARRELGDPQVTP